MEKVDKFLQEISSISTHHIVQSKIHKLTMTALAATTHRQHFVFIVESFVAQCPPKFKMWGLYLIDALIRPSKNTKHLHFYHFLYSRQFLIKMSKTVYDLCGCPHEKRNNILNTVNQWIYAKIYPCALTSAIFQLYCNPQDKSMGEIVHLESYTVYNIFPAIRKAMLGLTEYKIENLLILDNLISQSGGLFHKSAILRFRVLKKVCTTNKGVITLWKELSVEMETNKSAMLESLQKVDISTTEKDNESEDDEYSDDEDYYDYEDLDDMDDMDLFLVSRENVPHSNKDPQDQNIPANPNQSETTRYSFILSSKDEVVDLPPTGNLYIYTLTIRVQHPTASFARFMRFMGEFEIKFSAIQECLHWFMVEFKTRYMAESITEQILSKQLDDQPFKVEWKISPNLEFCSSFWIKSEGMIVIPRDQIELPLERYVHSSVWYFLG